MFSGLHTFSVTHAGPHTYISTNKYTLKFVLKKEDVQSKSHNSKIKTKETQSRTKPEFAVPLSSISGPLCFSLPKFSYYPSLRPSSGSHSNLPSTLPSLLPASQELPGHASLPTTQPMFWPVLGAVEKCFVDVHAHICVYESCSLVCLCHPQIVSDLLGATRKS